MSGLITRVVRVNGEEEQRSTVFNDLRVLDKVVIPVGSIHHDQTHKQIEVELIFDPPLLPEEAK